VGLPKEKGRRLDPTGRLELTWTNKHLRLISDPEGAYEWVDPTDPRVSEVRLLQEVDTVGDDHPEVSNLLIEGDALHALTALNRIPELVHRYAGQIQLVYIDPPFNTGQAFANYDDNLEHSVWLSMLRDRLVQLKPLLAPNGSIWVHLDDAEVHRCRCIMDEVLGGSNSVATVIWQKRTSRDNRAAFSSMHDYLLVYAINGPQRWKSYRHRLPDDGNYSNPDGDLRGPWRSIPMSAQAGHATASQFYEITTPTGVVHPPPSGRAWTYTKPRFEELLVADRVYWPRNGDGRPRLKRFAHEDEGLVPFTFWPAAEVGENSTAKNHVQQLFPELEPFATPKPEGLLERIIHIGTAPGDVVLDCFAGSGTTAAVAHKMGRRWVTSERQPDTVERFTRPRLEKVVKGEDPGGITDAVEWKGGGGFRHLEVGPSMFELDAETGDVFLAEWATNGGFSEAVAAQLGFERADEPPFCGRKGRTRLAVLDGVIGAAEVEFLVAAADDRERVVVVGQAFTEDAESTLRALSPGSRMRHAPHDLLRRRDPR
jgi:adenine-specific DNA-methyltransferase